MNAIVNKSADFLKAVLTKKNNVFDLLLAIEALQKRDLVELDNREKLIFWINVYNAFVQIEMQNSGLDKIYASMFTEELFTVAGEFVSIDMIEHGVLRGNRWKYGFGYVHGGHLPGRIRHWKCKKVDPRIHFLLNCGASSCPVIRVLTEENLDDELKMAESDFITEEVKEASRKEILVPSLFLYYLGDFGGFRGIRRRLRRYLDVEKKKIRFSKFDWSPEPFKMKPLN